MSTVSVRYIVEDVDAAIDFYAVLGFEVDMHPGPGFAALSRDGLRLFLNVPGAGGAADPRPLRGSRFRPGCCVSPVTPRIAIRGRRVVGTAGEAVAPVVGAAGEDAADAETQRRQCPSGDPCTAACSLSPTVPASHA